MHPPYVDEIVNPAASRSSDNTIKVQYTDGGFKRYSRADFDGIFVRNSVPHTTSSRDLEKKALALIELTAPPGARAIGVQGVHLNPRDIFSRTSIPYI